MRPAIKRGICLLGTCALLVMSFPFAAIGGTRPDNGDIPRCVAMLKPTAATAAGQAVPLQVYNDSRTNATFFFSSARDGAVRMTVKAADLDVEKTVYPDGRSRIVLQAGDDLVSVAISPSGLDVQRPGSRRLRLDIFRAADEEWLEVKVLLAGSKALRLFRALAANLDPRTLKTPAGAAVVLSDGVLGHLDGDVAAISRFIEQMRAARQARIRPVRFGGEEPNECWDNYQQDTLQAADDYDSCRKMYHWYDPRQGACVFVWTIQVESAWAVFLSCSSIRFPTKVE